VLKGRGIPGTGAALYVNLFRTLLWAVASLDEFANGSGAEADCTDNALVHGSHHLDKAFTLTNR
jgi:hypothetical protein